MPPSLALGHPCTLTRPPHPLPATLLPLHSRTPARLGVLLREDDQVLDALEPVLVRVPLLRDHGLVVLKAEAQKVLVLILKQ